MFGVAIRFTNSHLIFHPLFVHSHFTCIAARPMRSSVWLITVSFQFFADLRSLQLIDIGEGEKAPVSLLTEDGVTKDDLNLPDDAELAGQIRAEFDSGKNLIVSVLAAMGQEQIISFKEDTK